MDGKEGAEERSGAALARAHCQSCHAFPEPELLNKKTWQQAVLPEMGHRLGLYEGGRRPDSLFERGLGGQLVKVANIYPTEAQLSRAAWKKLRAYYLEHAPEAPLPQAARPAIKEGLDNFRVRVPAFRVAPPMTSLVKLDPPRLYVGDVKRDVSTLTILDRRFEVQNTIAVGSAPSTVRVLGSDLYVTNMGKMLPTDAPSGRLIKLFLQPGEEKYRSFTRVLDGLHRPVDAAYADLNQDGREDVVVCAFGFRVGSLAWYENAGPDGFKKHVLREDPGALRAYVRDFDGNGRPDVMALMGQGDEGVYLYYNRGGGRFEEERVLRFEATYGSTSFELADFNADGFPDILYTAGDNADYYPVMKKYHGVRIFVNDGENHFEEQYFYPLNGAYKALARDYDQDGDLDIAAISFFPDYETSPEESFVYLENEGDLEFSASTFARSAALGRWLVLESGDLDQDEDVDLVLGSFTAFKSGYIPDRLQGSWLEEGPSLVVLENTTN